MNKEDLEKLIDIEVSKVFSGKPLREPESKTLEKEEEMNVSNNFQTNLSEEELDEILFGKKEKK